MSNKFDIVPFPCNCIIHTGLFPSNCKIGVNAPTCLGCKTQPSTGSYTSWKTCAACCTGLSGIWSVNTDSRKPHQISLFPSTHATCFGNTDHLRAFKYMIFKTQNKIHIYWIPEISHTVQVTLLFMQ